MPLWLVSVVNIHQCLMYDGKSNRLQVAFQAGLETMTTLPRVVGDVLSLGHI